MAAGRNTGSAVGERKGESFIMARRQRIRIELAAGEITKLQPEEIRAILRAADELIATAGRSMLVKILKGSKDKKVLSKQYQRLILLLIILTSSHRFRWLVL